MNDMCNRLKCAYAARAFFFSLWPMMLYGICYFSLALIPHNSHIDIQPLYNLERIVFGITADGLTGVDGKATITFAEFFNTYHYLAADIISGICYLCWVPVPCLFALYLYFMGFHKYALRFSLAFLSMNLIGFAIHIIHPTAAPWYVIEHGFALLPDTPSNAAGLLRFDALIGYPMFENIYKSSTNVFGAFPSLHAAKMSMVCLYSSLLFEHDRRPSLFVWVAVSMLITLGTWFGAVYTAHHYIIDVLGGILLTAMGYLTMAYGLRRTRWFRWLYERLSNSWDMEC